MTSTTGTRSVARFRSQRDGWWLLAEIIATSRPFTSTIGSLRGEHERWPTSFGRLPAAHAARLRADSTRHGIDLIIYSYATPIAWHVRGAGWRVPDVTYSVTTSRHQSLVRVALANPPAIGRTTLAA